MGITGLIKLVEEAQSNDMISTYSGEVVAIDGHIWLHKAISTCVYELAYGLETKNYVVYCMKRVKQLMKYGIIPIIVFDGAHMPMKSVTNAIRRSRIEECKKRAIELLQKKKHVPRDILLRCISVTHEMVQKWIIELRSANIRFIVAPYEADPQLAYLTHKNIAKAVISEDSDLIVFRCNEVLLKLDHKYGTITRICFSDIFSTHCFSDIPHDVFVDICILSGCDYLPSPKRIGIKTALSLLRKTPAIDLLHSWDVATPDHPAPSRVPDYSSLFLNARIAFSYSLVFDPSSSSLVHLSPPPPLFPDISHIVGPMLPPDLASGIAAGFLHPTSHLPFPSYFRIPAQLSPSQPPPFFGPLVVLSSMAPTLTSDVSPPSNAPDLVSPPPMLQSTLLSYTCPPDPAKSFSDFCSSFLAKNSSPV